MRAVASKHSTTPAAAVGWSGPRVNATPPSSHPSSSAARRLRPFLRKVERPTEALPPSLHPPGLVTTPALHGLVSERWQRWQRHSWPPPSRPLRATAAKPLINVLFNSAQIRNADETSVETEAAPSRLVRGSASRVYRPASSPDELLPDKPTGPRAAPPREGNLETALCPTSNTPISQPNEPSPESHRHAPRDTASHRHPFRLTARGAERGYGHSQLSARTHRVLGIKVLPRSAGPRGPPEPPSLRVAVRTAAPESARHPLASPPRPAPPPARAPPAGLHWI